jgi:CRISPR-associated protein Cmr2
LLEQQSKPGFVDAGERYFNHVRAVHREGAYQSEGVNLGLEVGEVARLDGNLFYRSAIQNPRMFEFKNGQRRELVAALGELYQAAGGPPGNFYALLMMDGDSLGKVLGAYDEGQVSAALRKFANEAKGIIAEHHGVAVYLGGDDVLALLPMSTALAAATELRKLYQEKFENLTLKKDKEAVKTSISGALVFANRNLSLRAVYRQAHDLLDDVAKDGNGRDSLAVTVLRPGGVSLQWVSAWDEPGARRPVPLILTDLAADFQNQLYSTGFFYKIRERFAILANDNPVLLVP